MDLYFILKSTCIEISVDRDKFRLKKVLTFHWKTALNALYLCLLFQTQSFSNRYPEVHVTDLSAVIRCLKPQVLYLFCSEEIDSAEKAHRFIFLQSITGDIRTAFHFSLFLSRRTCALLSCSIRNNVILSLSCRIKYYQMISKNFERDQTSFARVIGHCSISNCPILRSYVQIPMIRINDVRSR